MSSMPYQPPQSQLLGRNPQLPAMPDTPGGAGSDSEYQAQEAILRAQIMRAHADILRQLGYSDDSGAFVPGQVEIQAQRQHDELGRSLGLAGEDVTNQMRTAGTLFSGRRATEQARAEHPFVQAMADLDVDVPRQLSDLYEQGSDLTNEYVRQRNLLLIDAAKRRAAALTNAPGAPPAPPAPPLPDPKPAPGAPAMPTDIAGLTQFATANPDAPFFLGDPRTGAGVGSRF